MPKVQDAEYEQLPDISKADGLTDIADLTDMSNKQDDKPESNQGGQIVVKTPAAIVSLDAIDAKATKAFCEDYVNKLVQLHLPKQLAQNKTIAAVIDMQKSMHTMSLAAMITVVRKSMDLLSNLTTDDMYTPEGMLDPFKLQAILSTYQHVMDFVARFNAQIRMMPSIVQQMITEASITQIIELRQEQERVEEQQSGGTRSNLALAVLMKQAEAEVANADDFVYVKPEPPKPHDATDYDNEEGGLDDI